MSIRTIEWNDFKTNIYLQAKPDGKKNLKLMIAYFHALEDS